MPTEVFQIVPPTAFDADAPTKPRGGRTKRTYRCRHCARIFKRSEHCARHERVHTQERPFPCRYCDRRYARKDLVKRHERSLHAEQYRAAHPEEFRRDPFVVEPASPSGSHATRRRPRIDSVATSKTTPSTDSPPTPANENGAISYSCQDNMDVVESIFNIQSGTISDATFGFDHPIRHELPSPFEQYSPLNSIHGPENTIALASVPDGAFETHCSPSGIEYCPVQFPSAPGMTPMGTESPSKRRRIEIDPVLLLGDASQSLTQEDPFAGAPSSAPEFSGTEDLSLTQDMDFPATHSQPAGAAEKDEPLLSFSGLSPDYAELFGHGGALTLLQSEGSENTNAPNPVHIQKEIYDALPRFTFDEEVHRKICEDARSRIPMDESAEAMMPTVDELGRFFAGYLECFHRHFPIIHLPSLDVNETPSPLIFAMCCIGAQYRLQKNKAKTLFALAGTMSSYALRAGLPITAGTPNPAPIWIMQTRILLSLSGMFSEKTNVVLRTVENLGLFAIDYRLRRSFLNKPLDRELEWEEWVSRETSKRLLCGMFIVSNLISTTFGINPGFSHTHDLEFEVPEEERMWNAPSAQEWSERRRARAASQCTTVREAMATTIFDERPSQQGRPDHVSGLTMLLIMHAVNVHMWSLLQFTDSAHVATGTATSNSDLRNALMSSAFSTLERCSELITDARGKADHTTTWNDADGPLMFNCLALLRIAYIRLFSSTGAFSRLTLLTDNLDDIASATTKYATAPQQRNPSLTRSIVKAYEGLLAPVKIGHLLVRKTAALSWSIEHAVAGWDAALLLTKWVHTVEKESHIVPPDADEMYILEELKNILAEAESDYDGSGSLAAAVATLWSSFLNDVWVWGVTPRMGNILLQLAAAYAEDYQSPPSF